MSTLVVLATAAAGAGALVFVLTTLTGRRRSRHRGGATATARAGAAALALAVAALALTPLLDAVELGLSAIALWWASLPWLALTARLSGWAHAGWAHAASAGAAGLLHLAWLATSQGLSPVEAVGAWVLWAVACVAAVLLLGFLRQAAAVADRRRLLAPRPAFSALWAAGAIAAASLAFLVHDRPAPAPTQAATPATPSSTTTAAPSAVPTSSSAPPPRQTSSRTEARGATTSRPAPRPVTTTAAARGATRPATPLPTSTSLSRTATTTSTTAPALDIKILPTPPNRPHTPPGHQ